MKSRTEKTLTAIAAVGVGTFFLSIALFAYLMSVSPTAPNAATNQVCSLNQAGYVFYVTLAQKVVFYTLSIGGCCVGLCAAIINQLTNAR
jgi:hypothetical protein